MFLFKIIIILINIISLVNFIFFYTLLMGSVWIFDSDNSKLLVHPGTWFLTSVILSSISFPLHILCFYMVFKNVKQMKIRNSIIFSLIPFFYLMLYIIVVTILGNSPIFYLFRLKTFEFFFEELKSML